MRSSESGVGVGVQGRSFSSFNKFNNFNNFNKFSNFSNPEKCECFRNSEHGNSKVMYCA